MKHKDHEYLVNDLISLCFIQCEQNYTLLTRLYINLILHMSTINVKSTV